MPYGGEEEDHKKLSQLNIQPYLFQKNNNMQLVYAGAMLPKAFKPLEEMFRAISEHPSLFSNVEFHFIGTGKSTADPNSYNIKPMAEKYGLWQTVVFEYPQRIPYLDVLVHLAIADAVFILGSTEPHYTPSKAYQGVLSGKPVLAILHTESTAVKVLEESGAGVVLSFNGEAETNKIYTNWVSTWNKFCRYAKDFNPGSVNSILFEQYSAKAVTTKLAQLLDRLFIQEKDLPVLNIERSGETNNRKHV